MGIRPIDPCYYCDGDGYIKVPRTLHPDTWKKTLCPICLGSAVRIKRFSTTHCARNDEQRKIARQRSFIPFTQEFTNHTPHIRGVESYSKYKISWTMTDKETGHSVTVYNTDLGTTSYIAGRKKRILHVKPIGKWGTRLAALELLYEELKAMRARGELKESIYRLYSSED